MTMTDQPTDERAAMMADIDAEQAAFSAWSGRSPGCYQWEVWDAAWAARGEYEQARGEQLRVALEQIEESALRWASKCISEGEANIHRLHAQMARPPSPSRRQMEDRDELLG